MMLKMAFADITFSTISPTATMTDIRYLITHCTMVSSRIKAGSPVTGLYQDQEQEGLHRSTLTGQTQS